MADARSESARSNARSHASLLSDDVPLRARVYAEPRLVKVARLAPQEEPVRSSRFAHLVRAHQATGAPVELDTSREREYFGDALVALLAHVASQDQPDLDLALLDLTRSFLDPKNYDNFTVSYTQIKRLPRTLDLDADAEFKLAFPGGGNAGFNFFETRIDGKNMICAHLSPAGGFYEVQSLSERKVSFHFTCMYNMIDVSDWPLGNYGLSIYPTHMTKTIANAQGWKWTSGKVLVLAIQTGRFDLGVFTEVGDAFYVKDPNLMYRFIDETTWQGNHGWKLASERGWESGPAPSARSASEHDMHSDDDEEVPVWVNNLGESGGCLCKKVREKVAGVYKTRPQMLCNFTIPQIVCVYEYSNRVISSPYYRLTCVVTNKVASNNNIVTLLPDTQNRKDEITKAQHAKTVRVDVILPVFSASAHIEFRDHFTRSYPHLYLVDLEIKHLRQWVHFLSTKAGVPPTRHVCENFGRQSDDSFVFANIGCKDGKYVTHQESGVELLPELFAGKNKVIPFTPEQYPRLFVVRQPWVRWSLFRRLWTVILKGRFHNNEWSAKMTFALSVAMLYCSKIWKGESGGITMVMIGWLFSIEGNTGKTQAQLLGHALVGFLHNTMLTGASSTLPAMQNRISIQADMVLMIDEAVVKLTGENKEQGEKIMKLLIHSTADQISRMVSGKIDQPLTSFIASANVIPRKHDVTMQSRMLRVDFKALEALMSEFGLSQAEIDKQWTAMKNVVSCLLPDFTTFLVDGKLDADAIGDLRTFFDILLTERAGTQSRQASQWANATYFLIMLAATATGCFTDYREEMEALFEYVTDAAVQQSFQTSTEDPVKMLILKIDRIRYHIATNASGPEDRCLSIHNLRTDQRPTGPHFENERYIAIKLDAVLNVLMKVEYCKLDADDIRKKVRTDRKPNCPGSNRHHRTPKVVEAQCPFWNCELGWPALEDCWDEARGHVGKVPVREDRLKEGDTARFDALFINMKYYDEVVKNAKECTQKVDYKLIKVDDQLFYNAIMDRSWRGFDALNQSNLGAYCGATNEFMQGQMWNETVCAYHDTKSPYDGHALDQIGNPVIVQQLYKPQPGEVEVDESTLLPAFRLNPFEFNDSCHDMANLHPMPDDCRTQDFIETGYDMYAEDALQSMSVHNTPERGNGESGNTDRRRAQRRSGSSRGINNEAPTPGSNLGRGGTTIDAPDTVPTAKQRQPAFNNVSVEPTLQQLPNSLLCLSPQESLTPAGIEAQEFEEGVAAHNAQLEAQDEEVEFGLDELMDVQELGDLMD